MNIQNNYGLNFGANRVCVAKNIVSKRKNDLVEIFELGKEDFKYVKHREGQIRKGLSDKNAQGRLKKFLGQFLKEKEKFSWATVDNNKFYIAIRNKKTLSGAFKMKYSDDRVILTDVIETNKQDSLNKKTMFLSFLDAAKKGNGDVVGVPHLMSSFKCKANLIRKNQINDIQSNIKEVSPNVDFQQMNEDGVNLLYYLA